MKNLYIKYNVKDINDYYGKISDSYRNGELALSREMFLSMPKGYRVDFTKDTLFNWHTITKGEQMFYYKLLTGLSK